MPGFGDITPRTDLARIVVSAQMLLDLVILGVVVRLIVSHVPQRNSRTPEVSLKPAPWSG